MKAAVMLVAAVLAAVAPGITGHGMGFSEWVNVGVLAAGAIQVYLTTNHYDLGGLNRYLKAGSAVVATVGVMLVSAMGDANGVSGAEWVQIVIAILAPFGVAGAPKDGGMLTGAGGHRAVA